MAFCDNGNIYIYQLINLIRTKKLLFSILKNSDIEKAVMRKTIEGRRDTSRLGRDKQSTNKSFGASTCLLSLERRDVMLM